MGESRRAGKEYQKRGRTERTTKGEGMEAQKEMDAFDFTSMLYSTLFSLSL